MTNSIQSISVVIPVYNSQESLSELFDRIYSVLLNCYVSYEIIFVNDYSKDGSGQVIDLLSNKHDFVKSLHLMRNYGQHNALLCGIRAASNDIIVTIDDDLQHPPEEIPKMLDKLNQGYDVIYGYPDIEKRGYFRNLGSIAIKTALKIVMGNEISRHVSDFRVFRTQLRDSFSNYKSPFIFIDVLLSWGTENFSAVKVKNDQRKHGKSNYTFRKLLSHAINMILGFSIFPLQLASILGFIFFIIGLFILVFILIEYLIYGSNVQGFPFLASIITFFSGVQLLIFGLIGQYLARLYYRSLDKPAYSIRKDIKKESNENSF